jgi:hypothetical protein
MALVLTDPGFGLKSLAGPAFVGNFLGATIFGGLGQFGVGANITVVAFPRKLPSHEFCKIG